MNLRWFSTARPSESQRQRLAALPTPAAGDGYALREGRFVVLDLETSGLNLQRDQVLSIGAVVIEHGAIPLGAGFERTLQHSAPKLGESVLIHGIAPSALAAGSAPGEALLEFLEFLGDSPVLGFHAPFDQRMLARALRQTLGHRLRTPFLDLADLAPLLCPDADARQAGLDHWIRHFGLRIGQRHNASADALVTAELALVLFAHARRQGLDELGAVQQRLANWRRRKQAHSL